MPARRGMRQHHEAEIRRQALRDRFPALGVVVTAVDAVVVLRVKAAVDGGIGRDLVHALAEFRVGIGHEVGRDSLVARLPGAAAVERAVDAAGAHRDVDLLARVVDDDGVRRGAAVAGPPFAAVRMVPEAAVELEVFAAVGGFPDRDRLAAGPDDARAGTRRRGGSARRVPGRRRCPRGTGWRPARARSTFRPGHRSGRRWGPSARNGRRPGSGSGRRGCRCRCWGLRSSGNAGRKGTSLCGPGWSPARDLFWCRSPGHNSLR